MSSYQPCKVCGNHPTWKHNGKGWQCLHCQCGRTTAYFENKQEAVDAWNRTNAEGDK